MPDIRVMEFASMRGHLDVVKWLYDNRYDVECSRSSLYLGASKPYNIDIVKFLHQHPTLCCVNDTCYQIKITDVILYEFDKKIYILKNIFYDHTLTMAELSESQEIIEYMKSNKNYTSVFKDICGLCGYIHDNMPSDYVCDPNILRIYYQQLGFRPFV